MREGSRDPPLRWQAEIPPPHPDWSTLVRKPALVLVAACAGLLVGGAAAASASTPLPPLPDPSDCHSVNAFLHIDNVRSCDGDAAARTESAPPPLPVSVQRRDDGSVCVTVSLQVPQCVGPVD